MSVEERVRQAATNFEDRSLTCNSCNQSFTWTAGEQAFYQHRGFQQPKRCPHCREKRKTT